MISLRKLIQRGLSFRICLLGWEQTIGFAYSPFPLISFSPSFVLYPFLHLFLDTQREKLTNRKRDRRQQKYKKDKEERWEIYAALKLIFRIGNPRKSSPSNIDML